LRPYGVECRLIDEYEEVDGMGFIVVRTFDLKLD
jgi:hypothetical protein